jgi:lysyl-tRNA synthetase class 2
MPVDKLLLAAMEQGLPPCSGVAVGLDRLIMLATGNNDIRGVLPFDWTRC